MQKLQGLRYLLLPVLIWFFYNGLLIHDYGRFRTGSVTTNYWSYLAESFLDGRTDLNKCPTPNCHDLVFFEEKIYMYWPPVPALFYMPIVALKGNPTPDSLIISIIGAINVFLFSVFLFYFSKYFRLKMIFWENQFWTLFWGLGTVHFFMSLDGSVWYFAQVLAQTFLLSSFIILIKKSTNKKSILLSGLLLALACYTRNNLLFAYLFAIGVLISNFRFEKWKSIVFKVGILVFPFLISSILNLYYNFIRFGNIFENGLNYHKMDDGYRFNFEVHGYFSYHYIPSNFWAEVLKPPLWIREFPFMEMGRGHGFGLLWASPIFILTLAASFLFLKKLIKNKNFYSIRSILKNQKAIILFGNYFALIGISLVIFSVMGPGYRQFASRYSLDYQIYLIIPILFFFDKWKKQTGLKILMILLLIISIYMNYFGTILYHNLDVFYK